MLGNRTLNIDKDFYEKSMSVFRDPDTSCSLYWSHFDLQLYWSHFDLQLYWNHFDLQLYWNHFVLQLYRNHFVWTITTLFCPRLYQNYCTPDNAGDYKTPNLALFGKVCQSSTFDAVPRPNAERAVDGISETNHTRFPCTMTNLEENPWWSVDFGSSFSIGFVTIVNHQDSGWRYLEGAELRIGDSPDGNNPRCATISGTSQSRPALRYFCNAMQGQYVHIAHTKPGILSLCEVKIYQHVPEAGETNSWKGRAAVSRSPALRSSMAAEQERDDFLMYFILMESVPAGSRPVEPGRLCCMSEEEYLQQVTSGDREPAGSLRVTAIEDDARIIEADVNALHPLTRHQAALLLAVASPAERLNGFLERGALEEACQARVGQRVLAEHGRKYYPAIIRYLGNRLDTSTLLPPMYLGVELEGEGEGCGQLDGTYKGVDFFKCKRNSGLFLPFNKVLFSGAELSDASATPTSQSDALTSTNQGEKEAFIMEDALRRSLAIIPKGNSLVQIQYKEGELAYGIIRWLGYLPYMDGTMAGVELEEDKGCTDGSWQGRSYFSCPPKRGIFVKLKACQPDTRFLSRQDSQPKSLEVNGHDKDERRGIPGKVPPLQGSDAVDILLGDMKGIQGHCNSCYMDAALFSLFSCSSALDSLLFKPSPQPDGQIQRTLREEIVNPLRKTGFVSADSVMTLRHQLMQESQCPSFTTSEKDPEEFLNLIMQRILRADPLLKLQSEGQRVQECYCYQIFIEKQQEMTVPNVQQLLEQSFHHARLKLAEIPSCFIIQMPRFGKEYKMFSKIVPSLEIDITDLLLDSPRECVVCGQLATYECFDCFQDVLLSSPGMKQYCALCSQQVHGHRKRKNHKPVPLKNPEGFHKAPGTRKIPRETLELFAVLSIETSHYVSFVKYGTEKGSWMFFDSMADRYGSENGYNIPRVSLCPEVATYLASPLKDLINQSPREMKGVAKRLFCDAYMYMYQSKRMALYK
ncbi:uncharacterized protein PAF06_012686 [Gastrophryne carolinensis]